MTRRRRRRRRWVVAAVVVTLGAGLIGCGRDGGVDEHHRFPARPGPGTYRILYRLETLGSEGVVTWEERIVRRPFLGRVLTSTDRRPPGDDDGSSGTLTGLTAVYLVDGGAVQELSARVPGAGAGDESFGVISADAVRAGLAVRLGRKKIIGRGCDVYRTGAPLANPLQRPTAAEHTDLCVDGDGFVLEEQWTADGDLLRIRKAVALDAAPSPSLIEAALATDDASAVPGEVATSYVTRVDDPDTFLARPPNPPGFRLMDSFAYARTAAPGQPHVVAQSYSWVFARDGDYVVVEAGTGLAEPPRGHPLRRIRIEGIGRASVTVGFDGSTVWAELGSGRWLRVQASAPPDWLEGYAARLRVRPRAAAEGE